MNGENNRGYSDFPASVPVSGGVSVSDQRFAPGVGGLGERERTRISGRVFRLPHTPSLTLPAFRSFRQTHAEHATVHAHAGRDPLAAAPK